MSDRESKEENTNKEHKRRRTSREQALHCRTTLTPQHIRHRNNSSMADALEWLQAWLNMAGFIWTLICYYLPWNGVSPAEVAEKYPVLIRPAYYTYTIWLMIYLGFAIFLIWQLLPLKRKIPVVKRIGWWYLLALIFQVR